MQTCPSESVMTFHKGIAFGLEELHLVLTLLASIFMLLA